MSLKEGTDRDRSTLVEKNQHQRVTGDDGVTSRLRAANSMTASTCSRSRPSNHSIISSTLAPASIFSKMMETGMRVPRSTHAPLTFPGCFPPQGMATNPALPRKDSPSIILIPFRGSVWISVRSEQREIGDEGWGGGRGQNESSAALAFSLFLECGGSTPLCQVR